jgi:type VI secretion system secreted protein Hcp
VTNVSKASPKLFLACATGQHIKEAMLVGGVKEGKDRQEFFNVKLTDILTARTGKADQAVTYLPTSSA